MPLLFGVDRRLNASFVSEVGARDLGRCSFNIDSSDEQTHLALLRTTNRLDTGSGFGFSRITSGNEASLGVDGDTILIAPGGRGDVGCHRP